jgi:hypothetical protein
MNFAIEQVVIDAASRGRLSASWHCGKRIESGSRRHGLVSVLMPGRPTERRSLPVYGNNAFLTARRHAWSGRVRHVRDADQLSHRAARRVAAALHPDASAHRRDDRSIVGGAEGDPAAGARRRSMSRKVRCLHQRRQSPAAPSPNRCEHQGHHLVTVMTPQAKKESRCRCRKAMDVKHADAAVRFIGLAPRA